MLLTQPPYKFLEFFDYRGQMVFQDDDDDEYGYKIVSERVVFGVHHLQGITVGIVMQEIEDALVTELPENYENYKTRRLSENTDWVLCFRDCYSEFFLTEDTLKVFPDLTQKDGLIAEAYRSFGPHDFGSLFSPDSR